MLLYYEVGNCYETYGWFRQSDGRLGLLQGGKAVNDSVVGLRCGGSNRNQQLLGYACCLPSCLGQFQGSKVVLTHLSEAELPL